MNVIFTSESIGKANSSAKRILSRYAELIGTDVWSTSITEEGLQTVKALLNRASSSKFSVACHRITKDNRRVLMWVVGNTRKFNHQGACSTGFTAKKILPNEDSTLAYPIRLMLRIASLAGLLHDIGKANQVFQKVLTDLERQFEEYRHEAVSVMMLSWLAQYHDDETWVAALLQSIEDGTLGNKISQALKEDVKKQRGLLSIENAREPEFSGCSAKDCKQKPLLFSLLWLMVSHHRLPDGSAENGQACMTTTHHRRHGNKVSKLSVTKLAQAGLPWQEDSWLKRLKEDLTSLQQLMKDPAFIKELPYLFDHVRLFARPTFQMADHWMSSLKKPDPKPVEGYAYANSIQKTDEKPKIGQKLHTHSQGVARYANTVAQELLTLRDELPSIGVNEVPTGLLKKSVRQEFTWQDIAVRAIKKSCLQQEHNAFFGLIMSGTGSGKTIGALKMIAAFQKEMRVMYASPLRSLTLQSGTAFEEIGFSKDDLNTIIGDAMIKKIYYASKENIDKSDSASDIEKHICALDECDESDDSSIEFGHAPTLSHHELLERIYSFKCIDEKALTMVSTPVLAATLDTVMKLADARRGGYLSHFLRVATSDLIIDEVDSYSPVDLLAIGRLIEACGFWRNRVFLSSATLSPIHAQALHKMYLDGLNLRNALDGHDVKLTTGWFSNSVEPKIRTNLSLDNFKKHHQSFAQSMATELLCAPAKRKVNKYYSRGTGVAHLKKRPSDYAERILQYVQHVHDATHFRLPDGRSFSFGCIQVVNVKSCQELAINLCEYYSDPTTRTNKDFDYRVICLHGRLSLASRNYIEQRLNRMLQRRGPDGDLAPLNDKDVQQFVQTSSAKKLCIILVSTLETTGRDHDFDWGMIESRSERDIIQFVGRIRRHRQPLTGDALGNVIIFNEPFAWDGVPWAEGKGNHPYSYFGVADSLGKDFKSVIFKASKARSPLTHGDLPIYEDMMQLTYGDAYPVITPVRVLVDEDIAELADKKEFNLSSRTAYTVRACETARLQYALLDARPNKAETLIEWRQESNKAGRLLATHAAKYRFRSSYPMEYYWYQPNENGTHIWFHLNTENKSNPQEDINQNQFFNDDALLYHFNEVEEISALMEKTGMSNSRAWKKLSGVPSRESVTQFNMLRYHYQIGLINISTFSEK